MLEGRDLSQMTQVSFEGAPKRPNTSAGGLRSAGGERSTLETPGAAHVA